MLVFGIRPETIKMRPQEGVPEVSLGVCDDRMCNRAASEDAGPDAAHLRGEAGL